VILRCDGVQSSRGKPGNGALCRWTAVAAATVLSIFCSGAQADRGVLAPTGLVLSPNSARLEYIHMASDGRSNLGWLTVGYPDEELGLELEAERSDLGSRQRETFAIQYSLTGNAFSDLAPAISVGVRDVLNRGREGRAFFLAATKTFRLSESQEKILRDWKLHLGYGSNRLDGAYIGVEGRLALGLTANLEYLAGRFNAALALPIARYIRLRAYTLDGDLFYGASVALIR
ncbi:MAG TPA: hypothetical protein VNJ09_08550, partial [Chthonomonadales bacterium]|nr:hypothetical protein [Chthonomonadales bacterium]